MRLLVWKYKDMYDHKEIEGKWQFRWREAREKTVSADPSLPKRYILDMFPYPSGAGLHAGHVESYTATDIYARYCRAKGFNVLYPQGFDAFGLPAENYAIKTGVHPAETTNQAIANFTRQINSLGFSYDWQRTVNTSSPEYYRWTQWIFLLLYKNGLAYKKKAKVNWCLSCQTVLANEQVTDGACERCGQVVVQKDLEQWFFKITDFIEDQEFAGRQFKGLLNGLDDIDWPESTKAAQRHWIGKSEGAEIDFSVSGQEDKIRVFTTRLDTIFGCTYLVLAPEHPLVTKWQADVSNQAEVANYLSATRQKTELQRTDLNKDKSGVCLEGIKARHPFTDQYLPVYIADYVLSSYGTGAVMAVPAHDERDFEFAKKYNLPIKKVIKPLRDEKSIEDSVFTDEGFLKDSGAYDGLSSAEARLAMVDFLEKTNNGQRRVNYRLRDWLVSRQRYWGAPIPIIYCQKCGSVPVPEKDLPVLLPTDVDFRPTGESPLKYSADFQKVACPKCGQAARRESDTMDTFVCSSWYYLRYIDPHNNELLADRAKLDYWLPVDVYVGGAEHSVMHLLYARFFTKVLERYGYLSCNEPFLKLRHQGIILGEDGNKMSKSKGNVVNPDNLVEQYGADSLRIYEMFMGPLEDMKPWNSQGIVGVRRFLDKVALLADNFNGQDDDKTLILLHKTIKKVGEDIENFRYNTAISSLMIMANALYSGRQENKWPLSLVSLEKFLLILAPFAPHLSEEIWAKTGHENSIFTHSWPVFNPEMVKDEIIKLVIQINGKTRALVEAPVVISEEEAWSLVESLDSVKKWLEGKEIVRKVFVPGRLFNIIVK